MGWAAMAALTLVTGGALWYFFRHDKAALQLLCAALLLGLAGYAWQGRPALAGHPKAPPERGTVPESEFAQARGQILGEVDRASSWLTLAEGYQRRGDTVSGVHIIQSGLRDAPEDADLWVGLGNALVVHADGMMSPAAQLAFQRAERIAPDHPGPPFFYALALAQGGNYDEAERIWRRLLADAPPNADYRQTVEERLASLDRARAMGQIPGGPQPQAQPQPAPAQPAAPAASQNQQ